MIVRSIGNSLMVILPDLMGKKITHFFDLVRPLIAFKFHSVRIDGIISSFRLFFELLLLLLLRMWRWRWFTLVADFEQDEQYFRIGNRGTDSHWTAIRSTEKWDFIERWTRFGRRQNIEIERYPFPFPLFFFFTNLQRPIQFNRLANR